jgi:hypothetical protein
MRPTKDAPDLVKSGELQTNPGELVDLSDFSGSLLDGSHGNRNDSSRKARELRSDGERYKKEQTECSGRTSTKATKETRDNKKGVKQQAGVALTWMKNLTIGPDASTWMKNMTVGCIHWMKNYDRRMHPHR